MSVKISSDIVMDVLRAAPPQRAASARSGLVNGSSVTEKSLSRVPLETATAAKVKAARHAAHQKFEAAMLRNFTEQMMPKEASGYYGKGTAANIWRSMQVDLMSDNLAKAGGIGIADMLDKQPAQDAPLKTAESLSMNELSQATSGATQLATAAEWPYFQRTSETE